VTSTNPVLHKRISLNDEALITWYFLHAVGKFQRSTHDAMAHQIEKRSSGSSKCHVCGGEGVLTSLSAVNRHRQQYRPSSDPEKRRTVWVWKRTGIVVDQQTVRDYALRKMLEEPDDTKHDPTLRKQDEIQEMPLDQVVGAECQICQGTGFVARRLRKPRCYCQESMVEYVRACVGLEDETTLQELRRQAGCWGRGRAARAQCPRCLGTGTPTLDACSTGLDEVSEPITADGDTLRRYALVSRRIGCMSRPTASTLERYYGVHGQSWADQPGGRMVALYEFTPSGRQLLKRTKVKNDEATRASPSERIAAQIALEKTSPERWRRELLDRAAAEARHAHQEAVEAWHGAIGQLGWVEGYSRLCESIDATGEAYEAWIDANWEAA
jgi:hypothetical protein